MNSISNPMIMGFDILPQSSPLAKKSPRYAMALVDGEVLETYSSIRRNELLKAIRRVKPEIIATDNLLELASTEKSVLDFLSKIPSKTRVIQVTGSPVHGMTSLTKLAKRNGLQVKKHPTPVESAILIAKLASMGVGTEVSALARETRIIISRARNIGPGGFSQTRYQRRMHGAIQQVARNILSKLTKAGMDFDKYETRTAHGWSRCAVHVYDSYDNIRKGVQSEVNRIAGVSVRIAPVKHRSILYLPREHKEEHLGPRQLLVIGIDAGTTVGIAISDVSGRLVALRSGRGLSRGDVIRYIVEFGKPILIAADVSPAPTFIEKLSTSLQTHLFTPTKLMSVAEKRELSKSFTTNSDMRPNSAHQRDALAAVAKVFKVFGNKLKLLNSRLQESNQHHLVSKAVAFVLQGGSVHDALDQSIIASEAEQIQPELTEPVKLEEQIPTQEEFQRTINRLQRQVDSLKRQLEYEQSQYHKSLEYQQKIAKELKQAQQQLSRAFRQEQREQRRDDRIRQKDAEIQRLEKRMQAQKLELESAKRTLTNLKLMRRLEIRGEVQPVMVLSQFSQEEIRHIRERYPRKRGKVVLIKDPSGGGSSTANQLIKLGVKVVIIQGAMSHLALQQFMAVQVPVISADLLRITTVDEFAVVDVEQLNQQIKQWREGQQATEHEATADSIERIIEEYRQERRNKKSV